MSQKKNTSKKTSSNKEQAQFNENLLKLMQETSENNARQTQMLTVMLLKQHNGSIPQRLKRTTGHLFKAGQSLLNMDSIDYSELLK